ncbi:unnamed protein product, partial [Owenia fusiformis]
MSVELGSIAEECSVSISSYKLLPGGHKEEFNLINRDYKGENSDDPSLSSHRELPPWRKNTKGHRASSIMSFQGDVTDEAIGELPEMYDHDDYIDTADELSETLPFEALKDAVSGQIYTCDRKPKELDSVGDSAYASNPVHKHRDGLSASGSLIYTHDHRRHIDHTDVSDMNDFDITDKSPKNITNEVQDLNYTSTTESKRSIPVNPEEVMKKLQAFKDNIVEPKGESSSSQHGILKNAAAYSTPSIIVTEPCDETDTSPEELIETEGPLSESSSNVSIDMTDLDSIIDNITAEINMHQMKSRKINNKIIRYQKQTRILSREVDRRQTKSRKLGNYLRKHSSR